MDSSYQSVTRLALALREGECSAAALLDETLARVDGRNPAINAVVATCREDARSRAREADAAAARGEFWGPLHGVPMTVKDTYEVVGMPATAGAPRFRDHYPQSNAVAVQRLLDAGAVIYGKTNTPLFAGDLQTYNEVYGVTRNPWDPGRTCGGSSGGSAAALAAGLTPLELGSDIGGSIRTPAAFCGVCGHKPSYGLIPKRGHIPGPPGALARVDISVAGPMARSVADLELAMGVLAGPDAAEGVGWHLDLPPVRQQRLADFRVAAWLDDPACPVDAHVVSVLQELVARLRAAGAEVDEQARPEGIDMASSHATYYQLLTAAMSGGLSPRVFAGMLEQAEAAEPGDDGYSAAFACGATQRHADWQRADERRQHMRRAWQAFFGKVDVLLCPVVHTPPFAHDHGQPMAERRLAVNGADRPYMDVLAWAGLAGVVYLPATVVPAGRTSGGLPVGVQIVGPYLEDYTTLGFARHVEALTGGFVIPPGYGEAPS